MRVFLALGLLLVMAAAPAAAVADPMGRGRGQGFHGHRGHFLHRVRIAPFLGGAYDIGEAPILAVEPPPPMGSAPPLVLLRRVGDDRPTVEQTASGVAIIRGPGSRHIAP